MAECRSRPVDEPHACRSVSGVSPFRLTLNAPDWRLTAASPTMDVNDRRQSFDVAETDSQDIGSAAIELLRPIRQILGQKHLGNANAEVPLGFLRPGSLRAREHEHAEKDRCGTTDDFELWGHATLPCPLLIDSGCVQRWGSGMFRVRYACLRGGSIEIVHSRVRADGGAKQIPHCRVRAIDSRVDSGDSGFGSAEQRAMKTRQSR